VTIRKPDKFSFWMVDTGLKTGPVIKWWLEINLCLINLLITVIW
jgi:hypothetical protein